MPQQHRASWLKRIAIPLTALAALSTMHAATANVFSDYEKNVQTFNDKLNSTGTLPRFNDRNSASLINQLTDQQNVLGRIDFNNDITALQALQGPCTYSAQLTLSYLGHGIDFSGTTSREQIMDALNKNGQIYQDEATATQSFATVCIGRVTPMMTRYIQSVDSKEITAEQRQGISQFRGNIIQTISGTLTAIQDHTVRLENRAKLLQAISAAIPNLAGLLPMNTRGQLKEAIDNAKTNVPASQHHYLDEINRKLSSTPCTKACQLTLL